MARKTLEARHASRAPYEVCDGGRMLHEGGRVERMSHLDTAHKAFHRHVGGEVEGLKDHRGPQPRERTCTPARLGRGGQAYLDL